MWMHYASQSWPKAGDIQSAVKRLTCELKCLEEDSLHATNYDVDYCFCDEKIKMLEERCKMYSAGASLCEAYSGCVLSMDKFCHEMVELGLKGFLTSNLLEYLPYATVMKFNLAPQEDDEDYQT